MTHRTVSGKRWVNHRASGMVCHVSSLPGPFGIGDLGAESRRFVDFLADADQTLWQILPLGPTGYGESPYMSTSAFGGNPLLIDPAALVEAGWLEPFELAHLPDFDAQRVDYVRAKSFKLPLLEKAYQRFARRPGAVAAAEFRRFCRRNAAWLNDYALFAALKEAHDFTAWSRWTPSIAQRRPAALAEWRARLSDRIALQKFAQWVFHQQWEALRDYCHQRGVEVIGDIPMYVAYDSADVWAHQDYFRLDAKGEPRLVAGVPPDYFSATGQRWGNPIYCWSRMRKDGYRWWIDRFRAEFAKCDILRIDHFRGFEAYWEIPARESTAVRGRWVQGPGARFFQVVRMALAEAGIPMRIIAEDLGLITAKVDALRDRLGFPGMRVLQVAFGNDGK